MSSITGIRKALWLVAALLVAGLALAAPSPQERVKSTVDQVIATLQDPSLDRDTRRRRIREAVEQSFDFRIISRSALSTSWKKATPEQRERFTRLFTDLLELTYMRRIEDYSDEQVRFGETRIKGKGKKQRALVPTFIVGNGKEIPVDYRLFLKGDNWYVYDVIVENLSLVSNYRDSYKNIVRNDGIEGLLAKMEKTVANLKAGKPEQADGARDG